MMLYRLYFNFSGRKPLWPGLLSILLCLYVFNVRPTDFPGSSFSFRLIAFVSALLINWLLINRKHSNSKFAWISCPFRIAHAGWHAHAREQGDWVLETPVKPCLVLIGHNPKQPPRVAPPQCSGGYSTEVCGPRCSYSVGRSRNSVDISWVVSGRFGLLLQKRRNGNDTARVIQNSAHLIEENKGGRTQC